MKYIEQVSVSEMYIYFATVHNTIATITAINPAITINPMTEPIMIPVILLSPTA